MKNKINFLNTCLNLFWTFLTIAIVLAKDNFELFEWLVLVILSVIGLSIVSSYSLYKEEGEK